MGTSNIITGSCATGIRPQNSGSHGSCGTDAAVAVPASPMVGEAQQRECVMSYEIRMSDSVINTGADGAVFGTEAEAQQVADVVNGEYERARAEVCSTDDDVTMTFAEWCAQPWG